jgi:excisionase family DNA binding protein
MQDQLYTVDEVADRLHVHPETVRRWLRSGRLEGVKLSASGVGSYRVPESAVAKFLAALGDQPPP